MREELLHTLLDVLRRSLAVKVDVLDPQDSWIWWNNTSPRLLEGTVSYFEDARELKSPKSPTSGWATAGARGFFVWSYGGYGSYLKRKLAPYMPKGRSFGSDESTGRSAFCFSR